MMGFHMSAAIEVRGLVKRYGDVEAVRGVDFAVARGEVFGLLGPNGAGKTTTVEILEGHRERTAGEVSVLGHDPQRRERALRERVGIVLQSCGMYRHVTVREAVAHWAGFYPRPRDVDEVVALAGLSESADVRTGRLSGGQLRRLDFALALVGDPELIFLDEPTTGFDPAARRKAWEVIGALRDLGTSVLLTTHYMEEAQVLADRVAVLRTGSIVGLGTPAELATQLRLDSTLTFTLPAGVSASELPTSLHDPQVIGSLVSAPCAEPTAVLAELCQWALERNLPLPDLQVRAPSLEESYLALTSATDTPTDIDAASSVSTVTSQATGASR